MEGETEQNEGVLMANHPFSNMYPIQLKYFNRNSFPRCGLTFCMQYGTCTNKICSWLIDELGQDGQKLKIDGWQKR